STRTAVFPDPAAAETRIFRSLKSITFCCCSVHFTLIAPHLLCPLQASLSYADRLLDAAFPLAVIRLLPAALSRSPNRSVSPPQLPSSCTLLPPWSISPVSCTCIRR